MPKQTAASLPYTSSAAANRKTLIALYITAVALYWAALYLYVPTLPVYAEMFTSNLELIGIMLAMYGLWQALIRLPLGIAADWLGRRKPFIIAGFFFTGLGPFIMGSASDIDGVIVGRAITGLAAGTWVPLVVAFSSLFPPHEAVRATAMLTLVSSISRMIATGVTGSLNQIGGYSLAFYLATGAAALATLVILVAREQPRPPRRPSPRSIGAIAGRRDVLLPSLLAAVSMYATWASTFGFIPTLAKHLGASDVMQSLLMSSNIAVVMVGNLLAATIVKRIGTRALVYISFALMGGGIMLAGLAEALWMVFAAQIFTGMAAGIGGPVLMGMSIEHVEGDQRTTAMGLHQAVYAIGMFSGPWLSGLLANSLGLQPMFQITAVGCLVVGVLGASLLRGRAPRHSTR